MAVEAGSSGDEPIRADRQSRDVATTPGQALVVADPGPLGLAGFGVTTLVLSVFNANLMNGDKGEAVVFGLALFYGGLAQLLAGMWEFRSGNTFGATAFTSYGAFWLSFWAFNQFYASKIPEAYLPKAVSLYLIAWGIFTAIMFVGSLRTTGVIALVFLLLTVTFFLLGFGDSGGNESLVKLGGYVGLATAIAALYGTLAGVANSTFGRAILPVGDLKRS
jgi:uncharacterized protein